MKNRYPAISVVLGSYNRKRFLKKAVESVQNNGIQVPYEIIVVDGGSTDGTLKWLLKQKDIITIVQHNRGTFHGKPIERRSWGYFMNLAFKGAHGKYVLMISDDCLLVPNAVMNGYNLFEKKLSKGEKIGGVAFYWRNWPDKKEYRVGSNFGKIFINHGMFLRKALEDVGWLDETYRFYHADADVALKIWHAGYKIVDCKTSFVEHYSHANVTVRRSNVEGERDDLKKYLKKWERIFYNPDRNKIGVSIRTHYEDPYQTTEIFKRVTKFTRIKNKFIQTMKTKTKSVILYVIPTSLKEIIRGKR